METNSGPSLFLDKEVSSNALIFFIIICLLGILPFAVSHRGDFSVKDSPEESFAFSGTVVIQGNSLLPAANPLLVKDKTLSAEHAVKGKKRIGVLVTAYSSTPRETDDTPFITASGTKARDGVVATNILPIGTKIRLPELYQDKVFVVEDRMSPEKIYHVDIWFPDRYQALKFGVKSTYIEIVQEA